MQKEELVLRKRLIDLSKAAYQRDRVTFSDFLNLNELNVFHTTSKDMFQTRCETFGGYAFSERQMVSFLPDALSLYPPDSQLAYPIAVIAIRPRNKKFAETLTHRDYLGALLSLGIERCKLGDILVMEEYTAVFVQEALASFIVSQLDTIKHTAVRCDIIESKDFDYQPKYEEIKGSIASVRLDSLLSLAFPASRSKLVGLIEGAKVFVNGKLITTNAYQVKEGEIISVRGMGRFSYQGTLGATKKGRCYVVIRKYV